METKALFVLLNSSKENAEKVALWLRDALSAIQSEPDTRDWYALRFGTTNFAIFDTFEHNSGRLKHLLGKVGRGLIVRSFTMLSSMPNIQMTAVLDRDFPIRRMPIRMALYSQFTARGGMAAQLEVDLPRTLGRLHNQSGGAAWYLLRSAPSEFSTLEFFEERPNAEIRPPDILSREVAELCHRVVAPWQAEVLASRYGH